MLYFTKQSPRDDCNFTLIEKDTRMRRQSWIENIDKGKKLSEKEEK